MDLAFLLSTLESPRSGYADTGSSWFSSEPPGTMLKILQYYSPSIFFPNHHSLIIELSTVHHQRSRNYRREQSGIRPIQSTE